MSVQTSSACGTYKMKIIDFIAATLVLIIPCNGQGIINAVESLVNQKHFNPGIRVFSMLFCRTALPICVRSDILLATNVTEYIQKGMSPSESILNYQRTVNTFTCFFPAMDLFVLCEGHCMSRGYSSEGTVCFLVERVVGKRYFQFWR